MKEILIEEIEANAAYIAFDTIDELKHLDDEYHYNKFINGEERKISAS